MTSDNYFICWNISEMLIFFYFTASLGRYKRKQKNVKIFKIPLLQKALCFEIVWPNEKKNDCYLRVL